MLNHLEWQVIAEQIEQTTKLPFIITDIQPVSGGCINSAYRLQADNMTYFIKLNQRRLVSMFDAEFSGLEELAQTNTIKTPQAILTGVINNKAFLVLENLNLTSGNSRTDSQLGQKLAALHKIQQPFFGWHKNNTIGSTDQINSRSNNWLVFWKKQRLDFQLVLAEKNGYSAKLIQSGEKLSDTLASFFDNYSPHPSLLHGDLWAGNAAVTKQGVPVIFDPACYYGDRETDIAMTELFGGFSHNFYAAYNEHYPLHPGYTLRKTLYNLYHILNHLNLFGESYLHQAQNMIDCLLSEIS